jgi:sugar phosphate isomerase/epimerase
MLQLRKSVALRCLGGSLRQSIDSAARIGAAAVEINARTDLKLEEVSQTGLRQLRKWLADARLQVAIVSFPTRRGLDEAEGLDQRVDGIRRAMALAAGLGCRLVSSLGQPLPLADQTERTNLLVSVLHDLARHSLKAGAWLACRTGNSSADELVALLDQLPAGSVSVDFDPASLLVGGHDPVAAMKALGSRVAHFRARDAVRDRSLPGGGGEVQLGRGSVDFTTLLGGLEEHTYTGFITVERQLSDDPAKTLRDCSQGLEFLDNLFQ